jgi:hypothetical protein
MNYNEQSNSEMGLTPHLGLAGNPTAGAAAAAGTAALAVLGSAR